MPQTYARTNENLVSIVKGLDVGPEDYILAVGGSGDQAFALLEYVGKVLAVDIEQYQVSRMLKQAESLRYGDYESFLRRRMRYYKNKGLDGLFELEKKSGTGYFDKERLDRIREKLPTLDIRKADILDVCQNENGFTKVYLSNALTGHHDELGPKLKLISQSIPLEGLVYASNGITINEALNETGFIIDRFLSRITYFIGDSNWDPIVLRKI